MQPLVFDEQGVVRFKRNEIINHLFESGALSLNRVAEMEFSQEDRQQLAQLLGYSVSGYGELGYVTNKAYKKAFKAKTKLMMRRDK